MPRIGPGDAVQTPLGKGVVREVRNSGRLVIDLQQRTIVLDSAAVTPLQDGRRARHPATRNTQPERDGPAHSPREIDLHGLVVDEALSRIDDALNEALLANVAEVRFIHGRSGGKLRAALHQRLRAIPSVRGFRLDPRNAGVTIVTL
ncbi:MAG: Smr/MutS family protein [Vicinamibacterales bacterium]